MSLPPELVARVLTLALADDADQALWLEGNGRLSSAAFAGALERRAFLRSALLVDRAWAAAAEVELRRSVLLTSARTLGIFAQGAARLGKDVRALTVHPCDETEVTLESLSVVGRLLDRLPALERLVVASRMVKGPNPDERGDCGDWHSPYCDPPFRWPAATAAAASR